MHVSEVHDYDPPRCPEVEKFLSEGRQKALKSEIEQMVDEEFDRLSEYANEYISNVAASRAEKFLERVLKGDDDAAMSLVGDRHNSDRYRTGGYDNGKPWCHLIRGSLFETGGIRLRREIVGAHADLLQNERIKDLEAVIDGLKQQLIKLEADLEESRSRNY